MTVKFTKNFLSLCCSIFLPLFLIGILALQSCKNESPVNYNRVVIGIDSDVESMNPLFTFTLNEGQITELLYASLVKHDWDDETGELKPSPMLAKEWKWSDDSLSVTFKLRDSLKWRDDKPITSDDIVFSFDLYSDPDIQSRLYGSFEKFALTKDSRIDLKKTFNVIDSRTIKINFIKGSAPSLFDIDLPIIPKHIFEKFDRKNIVTLEKGVNSITSGPFYLGGWDKNQAIFLKANPKSFLYNPDNVGEIIFKIVPDYNSRLTQLKKGEIDLMEDVKPDDAGDLETSDKINISSVKGRSYDYIGWNNIDSKLYESKKIIKPNFLFGSANVRKALTYAINRSEIVSEFLNNKGSVAVSPVSDIFKNAFNNEVHTYDYNPSQAKALLKEEGWEDINKDGILEKDGKKFSFTLNYPSGNPLREFASTIIKNNLKAVGIDVTVSSIEPGVFFENAFNRKYDAWMAGWVIAVPLDLKPSWYSNLDETPMNVYGYQNKKIDKLLLQLDSKISIDEKNDLYKRFQKLIHEDEPATFLYWIDDIVAYNNRINNITISPLGAVQKCWEWKVVQ